MPLEFRTRVKLALIKPAAVHPGGKVVTQDAFVRLPSGKILTVFEAMEEQFFRETEIGRTFSVVFSLVTSDRSITRLDVPSRHAGTVGRTTVVEGRVEKVERDTPQRHRVWIDTGECHVYFFTTHELKVGDFVRAEGRLEVEDKRDEEATGVSTPASPVGGKRRG